VLEFLKEVRAIQGSEGMPDYELMQSAFYLFSAKARQWFLVIDFTTGET
jgi:hypothetical protein